jgi:CheY-like chemotaxis protein
MTHGPLHGPAVAADQAARCAWQTTRVTPFGSTPFGRSCERARNLNIIETEDKGSGRQRGFMRALVVDDDDAFRTLLVALLAEVADVVAQAADGDVAVQLARDLRPDLIVMDITMPRMDGISAARAILAVRPRARIVFLSGTETAKKLSEASAYGVVIEKNVIDLRPELLAAAAKAP